MAKLTETRIEAIALAIARDLAAAPGIQIPDKGPLVRRIAERLRRGSADDPELDRRVRQRIASLSRNVPEGSSEWHILYRQYSEELARRR
jgi:hypothetical protein